jgi:hypothetical protein
VIRPSGLVFSGGHFLGPEITEESRAKDVLDARIEAYTHYLPKRKPFAPKMTLAEAYTALGLEVPHGS